MVAPHPLSPVRSTDLPGRLSHRVRPASTLEERTLPVCEALAPLLPDGLPRGATFAVSGDAGRSFVFAATAAATRAGSWLAVLGLPDAGWRAVAESGVVVDRVVHVDPGRREADCVAAALDGFDLVLVGSHLRLDGTVQRRLAARARERGAVLIGDRGALDQVADLRVRARGRRWRGIGDGWGHLGGRRVDLDAQGRRLPGRHRTHRVWLPDTDGGISPVADPTRAGSPTPVRARPA